MNFPKFSVLLLLIISVSCGTKTETVDYNIFQSKKAAEWIQDDRPLPDSDSLFYLDQPAPIFRKEFTSGDDIAQVTLFARAFSEMTDFKIKSVIHAILGNVVFTCF